MAGEDSDSDANHAYVGAQILWHEWDNHVGVGSGYRFDVLHHGHVWDLAILQIRLGKSPEDRRIDALNTKIAALELGAASTEKPIKTTIKGSQ